MNCSQAQAMLATYRELKNKQVDTTALDIHVEQCAACRQVLAQSNFVGERLNSLPRIEPSTDTRTKLLEALAAEHTRFMQQSPTQAPPLPAFLKPYIQEQQEAVHASQAHQVDSTNAALTTFTTAETGPLPLLPARHRRRQNSSISHFAVLGIAAAFLLTVMASGLVALLMMANRSIPQPTAILLPAQVATAHYTTSTSYTHVVSAVANLEHIYYTAYADSSTDWMLEQVDNTDTTQVDISTPLLETPSKNPLIVLGSSENWLVWLQFDTPRPISQKHTPHIAQHLVRNWALQALPIGMNQPWQKDSFNQPITLQTGIFDTTTAPTWVNTPIQGVEFMQNGLLVSTIDSKGTAQLLKYQLDPVRLTSTVAELATASNGHVLTSPTANSAGNLLYWSEEWQTEDSTLHSNIWAQETTNALPTQGHWAPHTVTTKYLLRADGTSFRPQVVNDTLFLLSTAGANSTNTDKTNTTQATPNISKDIVATATATPATSQTNVAVTGRTDSTTYPAEIDASLHGTILALPLSEIFSQPTVFSDSSASALQGGNTFLLWQSDKGYEMYDAVAKLPVSVSKVPAGATFMAVNGDTSVWTGSTDTTNDTATFRMFRWPIKG